MRINTSDGRGGDSMIENKKTPQDVRDRGELYLEEILKQSIKTNSYLKTFCIVLLIQMIGDWIIYIRQILIHLLYR